MVNNRYWLEQVDRAHNFVNIKIYTLFYILVQIFQHTTLNTKNKILNRSKKKTKNKNKNHT